MQHLLEMLSQPAQRGRLYKLCDISLKAGYHIMMIVMATAENVERYDYTCFHTIATIVEIDRAYVNLSPIIVAANATITVKWLP